MVERMTEPEVMLASESWVNRPSHGRLTVICDQARAHPFSDHGKPEAHAQPADDLHARVVHDAHRQELLPVQTRICF